MTTANSRSLSMTPVEEPGRSGGEAGRAEPPGPSGHWLWGCVRQFRGDQLAFLSQTWREHGDHARIRLFPGIYLDLLVHPDAVEHVLVRNHRNYRKPDFFNGPVGELTGDGLVTSEGETWRTQRKLVQPAFHRERLAGLGTLMVEAAETLVGRWERLGPGHRLDVLPEMMGLSLRIAGTTLFGADISNNADELGRAFRIAFAHIRRRMDAPPWEPRWLPTRGNRRFARAKKLLDRVVRGMIDARRKEPGGRNDVLSLLLAAQDEETGRGMSDRQLMDEVYTLLVAGHDTVGAALAWTWYLLGQHPRIQDDLHDEVRGTLGGRSPNAADLPALPLTRAVFEEALRLYPPALGQPREAIGADEVGGYPIRPKGWVMVCQYLTHRHPQFWHEPEGFDPSRFLPGPGEGRPKFAYFPFGGGPRSCVGNHFALMEATLVLATIAQRFRLELVPGQAIVPDTTFTLRPRPGVEVNLWPR
jgi:cytochrome P450